jgi:hypothetical protein
VICDYVNSNLFKIPCSLFKTHHSNKLDSLQTILALIFLAGIIGLIWTTFVYPRDVTRGVFVETPKFFLGGVLSRIRDLILIPFWLLMILVDFIFKTEWAGRVIQKVSFAEKSKEKRYLNIQNFKRSVLIQGMNIEDVEREIKEAADTIGELDITEYTLKPYGPALLLELPNVGLYGFGFIVQWLEDKTTLPVYGLAKSPQYGFVFYQSEEANELHGITSDGQKFTMSMTVDLDEVAAFTLNPDLELRKDFSYWSADSTNTLAT